MDAGVEDDMTNRSKIDLAAMIQQKLDELSDAQEDAARSTLQGSLNCLHIMMRLYEYPGSDIFWAPVDLKAIPRYK